MIQLPIVQRDWPDCQHRGAAAKERCYCHAQQDVVVSRQDCANCTLVDTTPAVQREQRPCQHKGTILDTIRSGCRECTGRPIQACLVHGACVANRRQWEEARGHWRQNLGICSECDRYHYAPPLAERVTVIMSAFRRPEHVRRQVETIRARYPDLKILIGDNGDQPPDLPCDDRLTLLLQFSFDCGLSHVRNRLADQVDTEFYLLVDDDYLWTERSTIERLVDVLDSRPDIDCVGGAVTEAEGDLHWTQRLSIVETSPGVGRVDRALIGEWHFGPCQVTSQGTAYYETDTTNNFALYRQRQFTRWDDRLKLGEHWAFFFDRKQKVGSRYGRTAHCPTVAVIHDRTGRGEEYAPWRARALEYEQQALRDRRLAKRELWPWDLCVRDDEDRGPVLILTVGHTGSSVLSGILQQLGWTVPGAADQWQESPAVRVWLENVTLSWEILHRRLEVCVEPWILKDPRWCDEQQIARALPAFGRWQPTLVWLQRNEHDVLESYRRRGEDELLAALRLDSAPRIYRDWPWRRMKVSFEQLLAAGKLVNPEAVGAGVEGLVAK